MSLLPPDQPSRNRSASIGDSGLPKHEHKRLRLSDVQDSEHKTLALSITEENAKSSLDVLQAQPATTTDHVNTAFVSPAQSPLPRSGTPDMTSPQSKVTINTRPISSQSSTIPSQPEPANNAMGSTDSKTVSETSHQASSPSDPSERPKPISISSSECGSPVIQVAVPEDLDQDPDDTQWEPLPNMKVPRRFSIRPGHVSRTFPFIARYHMSQMHTFVAHLSKLITDGQDPNDEEVLQKICAWIIDFASNATSLPYEFFEEEFEFWTRFPNLLSALLKRKTNLPSTLDIDDLIEIMVAHSQITALLIKAEEQKMDSCAEAADAKSIPTLHSLPFMSSLLWTMSPENIPLYEAMQSSPLYRHTVVSEAVTSRMLEGHAQKHMEVASDLFISIANHFSKRPFLIEQSLSICMHLATFINLVADRSQVILSNLENEYDKPPSFLESSAAFLHAIDAVLDQAITKQQPWLSIETCEKVFKTYGGFVGVLAAKDAQLAANLLISANVEPASFAEADLNLLTVLAWKFVLLQKCIKKGRMELRVASVQIMAQDLVEAFNDYIKQPFRNLEHPIVRFMIQFIRRNDVIRYIIGVDSHPQIIDRSANIIGFLCVSSSYSNEDTDIIWQTLIGSQDPRTVAALLGAYQFNLDNLSADILGYIVQKLASLPFGRIDANMLDFVSRLVDIVNAKAPEEYSTTDGAVEIEESIIRFSSMMLRESGTLEHVCAEFSTRIRTRMQSILRQKIGAIDVHFRLDQKTDVMRSALEELCDDLRAHNDFASGSALTLSTFLAVIGIKERIRVVQEHNLPSLIVNDIEKACGINSGPDLKESVRVQFDNRLNLLATLFEHTSIAISDSLIQTLWTGVLSNAALHSRLRSMTWTTLADVFNRSRSRNHALDVIVQHHLSSLPASLTDPAVLHFAQQSVRYEVYHAPVELPENQGVVVVPGIERIWHIMLTAPPNTVESRASDFIIEQYLDHNRLAQQTFMSMEATHLSLIDRCVQQVFDAANHLKPTPDVPMGDSDLDQESPDSQPNRDLFSMRFYRSLLFLRKFLNKLKTKPGYAPAPNDSMKETLKTFERKGQNFEVTLQIIGHKTLSSNQIKWMLGFANSGAELWQFVSDVTGWSTFALLNGGKRLSLKGEEQSLRELGFRPGGLIVNKIPGSPENPPARPVRASSPVDEKVMHHFNALYNLLELEDQFAREVFDFLRMFSSQKEVVQRLKSMTIPADQLLPVEKPFKLMYYAKALRSCIEEESYSAEPNTDFLKYGIHTILAVLPSLKSLKADANTCITIAHGLIEALTLGFRAKVPADISKSYINDHAQFTTNILNQWSQILDVTAGDSNVVATASLVRSPFEALVEGLLHDDRLWHTLSVDDLKSCIAKSILLHGSREVRQATLDVVHGLTGVSNPKSAVKNNETRSPRTRFTPAVIEGCLGHLWKVSLELLQQADEANSTCEEFFDALQSVFRQHQRKVSEDDLAEYIEQWKSLLLAHRHNQHVGLPPQDFFVSSLGKLLLQALKAGQSQPDRTADRTFIHDLFSLFLFPPLSDVLSFNAEIEASSQVRSEPVLDMHTRWVLYELIVFLSSDITNLIVACEEMSSDLVPKDAYFQPILNNDRQCLRSKAGYSGLRNLSNTCYVNSLLSQLFMNVELRELVMNVNIIDHSKQKLVAELGKVFAYMQNSYEESINPESAIGATTQWDGDQIDVTVQMDVDEFFNLLFDRLESQIVDPKVCSAFKGIYGGQLVQQIKSKECEHVSERLEPFTAVQVEIKGKATLEESLRAYVEGEVLQGENKYSCTGCGKHVDAVKRACLKTIPNHLIFNLKRFDYDIMTGMRCKVNDEFGFPPTIDMNPYTLEALSNPDETKAPDHFELVGVIIHSGTAESGHYYSYIRQRPSSLSMQKSWVQFNDHDVTPFDPASIKDCCFGGIDFDAIQCPKFYNGYMLFYQRSSSIRDFGRHYATTDVLGPVRLPLATALETHISQHNELYLRSYVAQDPVHARFVRALLQQKATSDHLQCLEKHEPATSNLLVMALEYLNQFSARWKDLPEVEETLNLLHNYAGECEECAQTIIEWLIKDDNLVDNLIRSGYMMVRRGFGAVMLTCWRKWSTALRSHQQLSTDDDLTIPTTVYLDYLNKFLATLAEGWEHLQRYGRAWEHAFFVLQSLLRFGKQEARAVIEAGFLETTLELVHVHVPSFQISKRLRNKYSTYLLHRERNRPFAHGLLIQLLVDLLPCVDLVTQPADFEERLVVDGRLTPSLSEAVLLGMAGATRNLTWLKKIVYGRYNPQGVDIMIAYLCQCKHFDDLLSTFVKDGLAERNLIFATAYLAPTIAFLSSCSVKDIVVETAEEALALIESTNGQYGKEYLTFVHEVQTLANDDASIPHGGLLPTVKKQISYWAPVLLMAPNAVHADVRGDTFEVLNEILFQTMDISKETEGRWTRQDISVCKALAKACATYAETTFITARSPQIHAGQANQASNVVGHCLQFWGSSASDEEEVARITAVMEEFKRRADGIVESLTDAEWNVSSDLEAMSEVDNMSDTSN